jgi:hypothetical protein
VKHISTKVGKNRDYVNVKYFCYRLLSNPDMPEVMLPRSVELGFTELNIYIYLHVEDRRLRRSGMSKRISLPNHHTSDSSNLTFYKNYDNY